MGADKALLDVDGRALAVRVATALADAGCRPVWCQGGDAAALRELGLEVRPDREPGHGPVAAIVDAYGALGPDAAGMVVAACDLPDLGPDAIVALTAAATGDRPAALATSAAAHLVSWWPVGLQAALAELAARGVRSYRDALAALSADLVEVAAESVRNVNRPGDL